MTNYNTKQIIFIYFCSHSNHTLKANIENKNRSHSQRILLIENMTTHIIAICDLNQKPDTKCLLGVQLERMHDLSSQEEVVQTIFM
jgi:hypothetical protein